MLKFGESILRVGKAISNIADGYAPNVQFTEMSPYELRTYKFDPSFRNQYIAVELKGNLKRAGHYLSIKLGGLSGLAPVPQRMVLYKMSDVTVLSFHELPKISMAVRGKYRAMPYRSLAMLQADADESIANLPGNLPEHVIVAKEVKLPLVQTVGIDEELPGVWQSVRKFPKAQMDGLPAKFPVSFSRKFPYVHLE